ncbi:hypothetical protein FHX77_000793 [Bifidobacterium commune]|uniref:hypothetical protein n=1 Tax=Bifidobacterium commune TaxID=1505727 RepID=UPI001606DB67|nr:hypothetical protein [Bifidobacterium commune]MBB2955384.1 hypothetical protein [Bifidobacterium commune]
MDGEISVCHVQQLLEFGNEKDSSLLSKVNVVMVFKVWAHENRIELFAHTVCSCFGSAAAVLAS